MQRGFLSRPAAIQPSGAASGNEESDGCSSHPSMPHLCTSSTDAELGESSEDDAGSEDGEWNFPQGDKARMMNVLNRIIAEQVTGPSPPIVHLPCTCFSDARRSKRAKLVSTSGPNAVH